MGGTCLDNVRNFFHPYLLPLKALYFFQIGAVSCMIPYIPLFIQHLGLNAAENGIIFGALPFIGIVSKPSAGALSDKAHPFTVLRVFSVIQLIFMFSIYFVPAMDKPATFPAVHNISCLTRSTELLLNSTSMNGNFICDTLSASGHVETFTFSNQSIMGELTDSHYVACNCSWASISNTFDHTLVRWTSQFWLTGLLLIIAWFAYGALYTLEDSIAFRVVESSPVQTTYGANRVFGTIGWALFSLLVGLLLDGFSDTVTDRDFTPAFATFAVAACCGLISTFFLRSNPPAKKISVLSNKKAAFTSVSSVKDFLTLDVVLFCFGTFVMGLCTGMLYSYLTWYQSELGATNLLIGITMFVQCAYETPMMAISGWVIRKLGYHGSMFLGLVSFAIRFISYAFVINPWFILLIDFTHAFGFGLFYASMTSFAFDKAPAGAAGTLQGIFGATYEGFGQGIGGLVAGFIYQEYGGRNTWLGYGIFATVAAVLYAVIGTFLWRKRGSKSSIDITVH